VLGGSSAINFAAIVYPTKQNFAAWTALGNTGWSADEMAPYFQKFHTFYPASPETRKELSLDSYMDPQSQGTNGPLAVTIRDSSGPFGKAWLETFQNLGLNDTNDPISGEKLGSFTPPSSINPNGNTRSYAASAYFNSKISSRPNLELMTETYVEKVLLTTENGSVTAKGLQVHSKDGTIFELQANEIILSAGALQSPQILELSGIGSKEVLESNGIPVIVESPGVGENFQDHSFAAISFEVADGQISGDVMRDPQIVTALLNQYKESRQGPMGGSPMNSGYVPLIDKQGPMGFQAVQQLVDSNISPDPTWKSIPKARERGLRAQQQLLRDQLLNPKESACQLTLMSTQMHYNPGSTTMAQALAKTDPRNMVSILVCLNHPVSRGVVHIRGPNPNTPPLIDPRYLSHTVDLEILARGVQFLDKLVTTEPLCSLLKPSSRLPNVSDLSDLEVAKEVVRQRLFTTFHPSSTCSMMPQNLGGVVDDKMRVYGVQNLRVVDASIFPMMTQGNIQASVYAVAERAADIIKSDWEIDASE